MFGFCLGKTEYEPKTIDMQRSNAPEPVNASETLLGIN